jgi:hypothetical protein
MQGQSAKTKTSPAITPVNSTPKLQQSGKVQRKKVRVSVMSINISRFFSETSHAKIKRSDR